MGGGMGFGNIINAGVLSGTRLKKVDTRPKKDPEPEVKPQPEFSNSLGSPMKKSLGVSLSLYCEQKSIRYYSKFHL
jgi:hypothetical protein